MLLELIACQLIVVTTPAWESYQGTLYRFERDHPTSNEWKLHGKPVPVVIGRNGMAWGVGIDPQKSHHLIHKKEGDGKSPAGIFSLGPAFGFSPSIRGLKIDYLLLDKTVEAIDDPQSRYYNQIVKSDVIPDPDWSSSEKMGTIALYEIGLVIHYNWHFPKSGAGSAIFMHVWENENSGTCGCTAMNSQDLYELITWLDQKKNPLLIQMPTSEYQQIAQKWDLKTLSEL